MARSQLIYCIVNSTDSYMINFDRVKENSSQSVRYNKDKSKCVVKFIGENTDIVNVPLYQKKKIIEILKSPEWK